MDDEKKRGWSGVWFWGTLAGLLAAYPLSLGPVERLRSLIGFPPALDSFFRAVYWPLAYILGFLPEWIRDAHMKYTLWWMGN